MMRMSRREKHVSVAVYLTVAVASATVGIAYQDMPTLLLSLMGAVSASTFGTGVLIAWKVRPEPESRDPRDQQMRILLEDATRLRAQTEKLHRDVVGLMDMCRRDEDSRAAPGRGPEVPETA
jgi:hypothetical protein